MLECSYTQRFRQLIRAIDWTIEQPDSWCDYFSDQGESLAFEGDVRRNRRIKVRAHAAAWIELGLHSVERPTDPLGIHTRNFSPRGCGLLSPVQIFPEEKLRLVLPTFWMMARAVRCRRISARCYDVGVVLIRQFDPSDEAFELLEGSGLLTS